MTKRTQTWALAALALTGALAGGLACIPYDGSATYEEAVFGLVQTTSAATLAEARAFSGQLCADDVDLTSLASSATAMRNQWNATLTAFEPPMPYGDFLPDETLPETLEARADASARTLVDRADAMPETSNAPDAGLDAQAAFLGFSAEPVTLRTFPSPSDAGRALMTQAGETPTSEDLAELAALDRTASSVRQASVRLFASLIALDEATKNVTLHFYDSDAYNDPCGWIQNALSHLERKDASAVDALGAHPQSLTMEAVHGLSLLLGARRAVVEAALALDAAVEEELPTEDPPLSALASEPVGVLSGTCKFFKIDFGGADTYTNDYRVLLEFGGNDQYKNNAGGNHCGGTCVTKPWALALDFKGADTYGDAASRIDCGVNGGAYAKEGVGLGFLMDFGRASADDRYYAGGKGTNGGAFATESLALGFIYDHEGNDVYDAKSIGTNGGAAAVKGIALGLAFDRKGDDTRKGGDFGVNGGAAGPVSLALLWDFDGADTYTGGMLGVNGGAAGLALGMLRDAAGNDRYTAGNFFTNGGGGILGFAFLVDSAGDDTYDAGGTGTNGGAFLVALGYLRDKGGKDTYNAGSVAVNGGATLIALGFLLDDGGDDRYRAFDIATNGGGILLGFGHVRDEGGNDVHAATHLATNGGAFLLSTGALRDHGSGADHYNATSTASNGGAVLVARGRIIDGGGSDQYNAAGFAANGGASVVAWGNIEDFGGDDRYTAGNVATNGGGFLVAWGRILDYAGRDTYRAGSCGVNGGGCMGGNGTLLDFEGSDVYQATEYGANGGGFGTWIWPAIPSKGLLVDEAGDDQYLTTGSGSYGYNGGGAYFGIGHLRDQGGNDTYFALRYGEDGQSPDAGFSGGDCGVNGGACWQGEGTVMDLGTGDDRYYAGSRGVNGGIFNTARQGTLVDQCGQDTYVASSEGANGGAAWDNFLLDDMGAGKLVDMGGVGDSYWDSDPASSGADVTRVRKPNYHGDQLDSGAVPCPGGVPVTPTRPAPLPLAQEMSAGPVPGWVARMLREASDSLEARLHEASIGPAAVVDARVRSGLATLAKRLGGEP